MKYGNHLTADVQTQKSFYRRGTHLCHTEHSCMHQLHLHRRTAQCNSTDHNPQNCQMLDLHISQSHISCGCFRNNGSGIYKHRATQGATQGRIWKCGLPWVAPWFAPGVVQCLYIPGPTFLDNYDCPTRGHPLVWDPTFSRGCTRVGTHVFIWWDSGSSTPISLSNLAWTYISA